MTAPGSRPLILPAEEARTHFQAELLDRVGQPVMAVDREHHVVYWNRAAEELTGWSWDEIREEPGLARLLTEEVVAKGLAALGTAAARAEWTGELALRRKDGGEVVVQVSVTPVGDSGVASGCHIAVGADITEQAEGAERIRFQAELLDAVGQAVIATDLEGRVMYWNRAAEGLYGWRGEDVLGVSILELTVPPDGWQEQAAEIMVALRRGESWTGEFLARRKDGSTFMALVTDAPIHDAEGRLTGMIAVTSDISQRRELEEQLRQAQKMEAVGRLAGGVAHDFNNILTVIRGHSELLLEDLPRDSPHAEDVRQVLMEADRAAILTRQLLAFSRRQVLQERILDMPKVVEDMAPMLRRLIPAYIELRFETGDGPRLVRVDPSQLHQVILNLAVNASHAIQDGGSITFRVVGRMVSGTDAHELPRNIEAGAYVELAVEDTGCGIAADVIDHIFEPFFTTKPEGQGTGLGLSMTFGIVEQSGGHILVESEPGRGTTFRVLFPWLTEGEAQEVEEEAVAVAGRVDPLPATVLLVEDDPSVRHVSVRMLKRAGYTVLEASNGREALELVALNRDRIDLVVSDIVMPEVGGLQLLERLRTMWPDLRIVLTSGYSHEELPQEIRRKGTTFLEKPFSQSELMNLVQAALE